MSYGGSHLVAEFLALGMISGMARYARAGSRSAGSEWSGGYESSRV
jgi:cell division protein FtsW (lipid II flippase)